MTTSPQAPSVPLAIPLDAKCLGCGYSLRGLQTDACPECGRAFNRADPATYMRIARKRRWWVRYARPPGLWHVRFAVVLTLSWLVNMSSPGGALSFPVLFIFGVPLVVLLIWLPVDYSRRVIASLWLRRPRARRSWRWLVLPCCGLLMLSAKFVSWPLIVRFAISRPSFESVVAGGAGIRDEQFIGLFYIRAIHQNPDGCVFFSMGSPDRDDHGIIFEPAHSASCDGKFDSYETLAPNWYAVQQFAP